MQILLAQNDEITFKMKILIIKFLNKDLKKKLSKLFIYNYLLFNHSIRKKYITKINILF